MTSTQGHPIFPVIQPKATQVHTYHRDGQMWFDDNGGASPVYEPNSFGGPKENPACKEPPLKISGNADHFDQPRTDTDFIQPGKLFKLMPADAQALGGRSEIYPGTDAQPYPKGGCQVG
jgi:catalase